MKFNKKAMNKTNDKLDYVHSDLWDTYRVLSNSGVKYFQMLIEDYSLEVWVYFLKSTEEAFSIFVIWKTIIEKQTERKMKCLRTDNGLEFYNHVFNDFYNI